MPHLHYPEMQESPIPLLFLRYVVYALSRYRGTTIADLVSDCLYCNVMPFKVYDGL